MLTDCFIPLRFNNGPQNRGEALLEKVDSYLFIGNKYYAVRIIENSYYRELQDPNQRVTFERVLSTVVKVVSYTTIILPLLALVFKVVLYRLVLPRDEMSQDMYASYRKRVADPFKKQNRKILSTTIFDDNSPYSVASRVLSFLTLKELAQLAQAAYHFSIVVRNFGANKGLMESWSFETASRSFNSSSQFAIYRSRVVLQRFGQNADYLWEIMNKIKALSIDTVSEEEENQRAIRSSMAVCFGSHVKAWLSKRAKIIHVTPLESDPTSEKINKYYESIIFPWVFWGYDVERGHGVPLWLNEGPGGELVSAPLNAELVEAFVQNALDWAVQRDNKEYPVFLLFGAAWNGGDLSPPWHFPFEFLEPLLSRLLEVGISVFTRAPSNNPSRELSLQRIPLEYVNNPLFKNFSRLTCGELEHIKNEQNRKQAAAYSSSHIELIEDDGKENHG